MASFRLFEFLLQKGGSCSQFTRYIFCGGISVFIDQLIFYTLAWLVFPALRQTDPFAKALVAMGMAAREVSEEELNTNYWIIKAICFIASNAMAYLLNVLLVFQGGRHQRSVEILMFFGFSLLQFCYIWLGGILISRLGWEVTHANLSVLIFGTITNYVARKKIIFKD